MFLLTAETALNLYRTASVLTLSWKHFIQTRTLNKLSDVFSLFFFSLRSTLLAAPVSTASSRVMPSPGRPALPCQPTQNAAVPRGLAWDSEHFMSLLPLPRPHARLSLQETRLSKWLTNRHGGDAAALECVTLLCPNLIWIVRIFLSARSDGFTLNSDPKILRWVCRVWVTEGSGRSDSHWFDLTCRPNFEL